MLYIWISSLLIRSGVNMNVYTKALENVPLTPGGYGTTFKFFAGIQPLAPILFRLQHQPDS